ncbi:MAG: radical SAM protein [Candidatus Aminicenantes bacterium]|jgi:uncharacterized protein
MITNRADNPFIKKFSDCGFFYIYDVNTNQLVEVEKSVYDIIDEYVDDKTNGIESPSNGTYGNQGIKEIMEKINKARVENGLFSNFRPKKVTLGLNTADGVRELHAKGLSQIIIEVSRICNCNCAYCATSGKYSKSKNFKIHMSRETCRKAVDFFCERALNSEDAYISFYGGEPLLRFDLIRETVEYVKTKYQNKKYSFNLTTNGTLINKEILDFLIENDFSIMVSLDGPEHINDRYRRFKNGKGSFKRILKNLEFIREYNKDYYSSRVSISCVLAPPFDKIDDILDFFSTYKIFKEIKDKIRSNTVDTSGTSFIEDFDLGDSFNDYSTISNKFIERFKKAILDNNLNNLTIEKTQVYNILYNFAKRAVKSLYDHVQPLGACHIGMRRVFVTTNGDFYICERAGDNYKIGCVDHGFDYERIAFYYRKLEEVLEDCRSCWAIIYCERCWALIGNLDEFTGKRKEEFCTMNKKIIEKAFKLYTQLLREDPDCLKVFKDVIVG